MGVNTAVGVGASPSLFVGLNREYVTDSTGYLKVVAKNI